MSQKVLELGNFEEVRNGVPIKFKVTTVPHHLTDDVIEFMTIHFIPREPLCKYFNALSDPETVPTFKGFWQKVLKDNTAMVAIKEGPEDEKERIIGANMTAISYKDDPEDKSSGIFKKIIDIVIDITNRGNVFERYGVDKYLTAFGLCVHPDYSGYRIGERILECRKPLCKAFGLKLTETVFTNLVSIHLAEKVGFVHLYEVEYSNYTVNGEFPTKDLNGKITCSVLVYN